MRVGVEPGSHDRDHMVAIKMVF